MGRMQRYALIHSPPPLRRLQPGSSLQKDEGSDDSDDVLRDTKALKPGIKSNRSDRSKLPATQPVQSPAGSCALPMKRVVLHAPVAANKPGVANTGSGKRRKQDSKPEPHGGGKPSAEARPQQSTATAIAHTPS